ncbi:MAG: hypothetical protein E3J72_06175 [Planctomycetota bacterium]|nr:MAG: hypothetical protein E3J72_06175 [Planctomycetota bacterium]
MKPKHALYSIFLILLFFGLVIFCYAVRKPVIRGYRLNQTHSEYRETRMKGFRALINGGKLDLEAANRRLLEIENTEKDIDRIKLATSVLGGQREPNNAYLAIIHGSKDDKHLWPMFDLVEWWADSEKFGGIPDHDVLRKAGVLNRWQRASCATMFGCRRLAAFNPDNWCGTICFPEENFAANVFNDMGNAAEPYFINKLTAPDAEAAQLAAWELYTYDCPGANAAMLKALTSTPSPYTLVEILFRLNADIRVLEEPFMELLDSAVTDEQLSAGAYAMELIKNRDVAPRIAKLLSHQSKPVRTSAASYFCRIKYPAAAQALKNMLKMSETCSEEFCSSATALGFIEPEYVVKVCGPFLLGSDYMTRIHMTYNLADFPNAVAMPLLLDLVNSLKPVDIETDNSVEADNIDSSWNDAQRVFDILRSECWWLGQQENLEGHLEDCDTEDEEDISPIEWQLSFRRELNEWWEKNRRKTDDDLRREAVMKAVELSKQLVKYSKEESCYIFWRFHPLPISEDMDPDSVSEEEITHNLDRFKKYILREWPNLKFRTRREDDDKILRTYHPGTFRWEKLPGGKTEKGENSRE